jgi:hypothetical protein
MTEPEPLRLVALEPDDLVVISAHAQDAVVRAGDILWRPGERRLVLLMRRFDWEGADKGEKRRRLAALHFARVGAVKALRLDPRQTDHVLSLLAVTFTPDGEGPSGSVTLTFAGGPSLRAEVECLEVQLKDLGGMWETASQPAHDLET